MDHFSSWPLWLRILGVHQDYLWFVALLTWSLSLVIWWWHPRRNGAWRWLPWFASATIGAAAIQFGIFSPPFDFFHDRLKPGTLFDYQIALIEAGVLGDLLVGISLAIPVVGWWRAAFRGTPREISRHTVFAGAIALGVFRFVHPTLGFTVYCASLIAGVALLRRHTGGDAAARRILAISSIVPLFSLIGYIAILTDTTLRSGPPTPMGAIAATAQAASGLIAMLALIPGVAGSETRTYFTLARRGWPAVLGAIVWLSGGIGFAQKTGTDNRNELLQNRLRLTAARAAQFDTRFLAQWNADDLKFARGEFPDAGGEPRTALIPELARGTGRVLALQMIKERDTTIYVEQARLIVVSDGWLVSLASSHPQHAPGTVELLRRATPGDIAAWNARQNVVETSPAHEIGVPYLCRAPVIGPDGSMLAWLEFRRSEFFQSIERKWRTGPLLVTTLGLVLGLSLVLQRRAAQEREAALRVAAAQESANQMKSVFLAKVSHELRTPIQSLLGYSELLRREVAGRPIAQSWLNSLQQHGELMTRLVNDLIDLGAIEAGTFRLSPRPTRVSETITRAVESIRPRAEAKQLKLSCRVELIDVEWAMLDPERLRQIVINLVGNAVKFTSVGEVTVALRQQASTTDGTPLLAIEVCDTGPGVPLEDQSRIFAAFTRLEPTLSHEGSGLGLALSAALCRAMGGDVAVESDGKSGSCFLATIRAPRCEPAQQIDAGPPPDLRGRRVLVVDDNPLVRELFVTSLATAGAVCATAASAAEAVLEASANAPDVAVVDLGLPDADGTELAARLRGLFPPLRIVGVSAHAGSAERERALAAGMNEFLVKPVSIQALVSAVAGTAGGATPPRAVGATVLHENLLAEFRAELPSKRAMLRQAVEAQDRVEVRKLAHYLANSAAAIDDRQLLECCLSLENAAVEKVEMAELRDAWATCDACLDAKR